MDVYARLAPDDALERALRGDFGPPGDVIPRLCECLAGRVEPAARAVLPKAVAAALEVSGPMGLARLNFTGLIPALLSAGFGDDAAKLARAAVSGDGCPESTKRQIIESFGMARSAGRLREVFHGARWNRVTLALGYAAFGNEPSFVAIADHLRTLESPAHARGIAELGLGLLAIGRPEGREFIVRAISMAAAIPDDAEFASGLRNDVLADLVVALAERDALDQARDAFSRMKRSPGDDHWDGDRHRALSALVRGWCGRGEIARARELVARFDTFDRDGQRSQAWAQVAIVEALLGRGEHDPATKVAETIAHPGARERVQLAFAEYWMKQGAGQRAFACIARPTVRARVADMMRLLPLALDAGVSIDIDEYTKLVDELNGVAEWIGVEWESMLASGYSGAD